MELLSSNQIKAAFPDLLGNPAMPENTNGLPFAGRMVATTQFKPTVNFGDFVVRPKFVRSPLNAASMLDSLSKAERKVNHKVIQNAAREPIVSQRSTSLSYPMQPSLSLSNQLRVPTHPSIMLQANRLTTGQYQHSPLVQSQSMLLNSGIPNFVMNGQTSASHSAPIYAVEFSSSITGRKESIMNLETKKRRLDVGPHSVQAKKSRRTKSKKGSMYKGVTLEKKGKKWRSKLSMNGNLLSLGSFDDEEVAAKVWSYMKLVLKCPNGRNTKEGKIAFEKELPELNFPDTAVKAYDDLFNYGIEPDFFPKPKPAPRRRRKQSKSNESKTDSPVDIQKLIDRVKGKGKGENKE
mmetsp:Transcript_7278/g.8341  ORF Transcript_7278/g.8341 Transcript_7278/m.8341 type:complete len:350 (+) Transcript_7278:256-1305(+)